MSDKSEQDKNEAQELATAAQRLGFSQAISGVIDLLSSLNQKPVNDHADFMTQFFTGLDALSKRGPDDNA